MSAPLKVLLFSICVVLGLMFIVLYRFELLKFKVEPEITQTTEVAETPLPKVEREIDLANGKKLYEVKTCVLCHGADGKANTPMGRAVSATDLTLAKFKDNTKNLPRMDYIFQVIENGVPGTAMVSFKDQIKLDTDKLDLAGYVNSLQK